METEIKFAILPQKIAILDNELRKGNVQVQHLQAVYYDTVDEKLSAHKLAVRSRKEGQQWVQTAKAGTAHALSRIEHNVNVRPARSKRVPVPDLSLHEGTPAGALLETALGVPLQRSHEVPLIERFRTDVLRTTRIETLNDTSVELALDIGTVKTAEMSLPISEFEVEWKAGPIKDFFHIASVWSNHAGLWLDTVSKAERGHRLLHSKQAGQAVQTFHAEAPVIKAKDGKTVFLVTTMQSCLTQILGNASEIGAGAADDEFIHQLRVGLRRMRTALKELACFSPNITPEWETVCRKTFRALGEYRDRVTVFPVMLDKMKKFDIKPDIPVDKTQKIQPPASVVQDAEFQRALLAMMAFCHGHDEPASSEQGKHAHKKLKKETASLLKKRHAQLVRDAKKFSSLSLPDQHRVRKRLKRLRYLSEFSASLFGINRVQSYLKHWRKVQNALGDLNDYRTGRDIVQDSRRPHRELSPALAWFTAHINKARKRCKKKLGKGVKVPVFWEN